MRLIDRFFRYLKPSVSVAVGLLAMAWVGPVTASSQAQPSVHLLDREPLPTPPLTREELREAVRAHRAAESEKIQRDERLVGRRLTPAERAELREQLRQEWTQRSAQAEESPESEDVAGKGGWSWRRVWRWGSIATP